MHQSLCQLQKSAVPHLAWNIIKNRGSQQPSKFYNQLKNGSPQSYRRTIRSATYTLSIQRYASTSTRYLPSSAPRTRALPRDQASQSKPLSSPSHRQDEPGRIRFMFWVSMFTGSILVAYISFLYVSYSRSIQEYDNVNLAQNADVSDRYNDLGRDYDEEVDTSEKFLLMRQKRKRLIGQANGNVLEVSVGTGRNMEMYDLRPFDSAENASTGRSRDRRIRSLLFNDQSPVMVSQAQRKFEDMQKRAGPEAFDGKVEFVVGDAGIRGVIRRPPGGFDTIVQTMGICSMVDATGFLKRLGDLCRQPGEKGQSITEQDLLEDEDHNKGGKILLLEHGRSHYNWLNQYLDKGAKMHADHYGCWFNKDIGQIVQDSGLEVEYVRRYHLGTTWEIVLRPRRKD